MTEYSPFSPISPDEDSNCLSAESLPDEKIPIDETSAVPKFSINSETILTIDQSTYISPDISNHECFSPTIIRPACPSRVVKTSIRPRSNSSSLSPSCKISSSYFSLVPKRSSNILYQSIIFNISNILRLKCCQ